MSDFEKHKLRNERSFRSLCFVWFVNVFKRDFYFGKEPYFYGVKTFRKILVIGFSVVYFFLSTGFMLFQTHCECLGRTSVSLFVASDSCNEVNPEHDCCSLDSKCEHCQSDKIHHSCGCDSPVVSYLKLSDHFGEDSDFEYPLAKIISLLNISVIETVVELLPEKSPVHFTSYSPPENQRAGRLLINFLNQRKIAFFA